MTDLLSSTPAETLRRRLDDPKVAGALNDLLDNAELLALVVGSLDGLIRRSETIAANVEGSLQDVRALTDSAAFLAAPTRRLAEEAPAIADAATALLDSGMLSRDVVSLLGRLAGALVEGADIAARKGTSVSGPLALMKALKDPEVGRGLGLLLEVSRALGRTL